MEGLIPLFLGARPLLIQSVASTEACLPDPSCLLSERTETLVTTKVAANPRTRPRAAVALVAFPWLLALQSCQR